MDATATTASVVLTAILEVFTVILEWFVSSIGVAIGIFWDGTALTFVGTLAVIGFAIAVILMLMAMIRSYLKNRG